MDATARGMLLVCLVSLALFPDTFQALGPPSCNVFRGEHRSHETTVCGTGKPGAETALLGRAEIDLILPEVI
ncbi:hypothetical protein CLAFUW4_20064 [Fulvia fulva]|nr:hypothetical protein CLAFUR4_20064 [Fulvia fulva]KAK4620691.1 hypothetical protein CLAFUR0_20064 [Fulvia fulva]WPV17013.1 hypothetical protein CLAFUW4_20064 [Fulvia fulva]WPV32685.1 hypothetical protein CLAFUW7_20064 [Fulvia fulva]